jgi:FkbM family methyltransferase
MFRRALKRIRKELYFDLMARCGKKRVTARLSSGQRLSFRLNDQLARSIFADQSFEMTVRHRMLGKLKPGMVVLDIGSNIGYYAIEFAAGVGPSGKVVAFEPNPVMIAELTQNVALNRLQNVLIQPIALSNEESEGDFFCPQEGREGHGSLRPNETFQTTRKIRIRTRRLDDVLQELDIKAVDLIKMDVEGAEWKVFDGARRLLSDGKRPELFFECADLTCRAFGHSVLDVLNYISNHGYDLEQIDFGIWHGRPK